jgi:hypothetical protein
VSHTTTFEVGEQIYLLEREGALTLGKFSSLHDMTIVFKLKITLRILILNGTIYIDVGAHRLGTSYSDSAVKIRVPALTCCDNLSVRSQVAEVGGSRLTAQGMQTYCT